ncbi:MAG: hypothetical protein IPM17_14505 [Verrucomicrobia bacterium]|nr:hypothetical protein [Verrucomicrobiota bacterium]
MKSIAGGSSFAAARVILSIPREGGPGAEKLRKEIRQVHECEAETNDP